MHDDGLSFQEQEKIETCIQITQKMHDVSDTVYKTCISLSWFKHILLIFWTNTSLFLFFVQVITRILDFILKSTLMCISKI